MRAFLGTVLSTIAVGVLLIAYGLLAPRAGAISSFPQGAPVVYDAQTGTYQLARPMYANERAELGPDGRLYASPQYIDTGAVAPRVLTYPASEPRPVTVASTAPAPRRIATSRVSVDRRRDWKKTAMVIGGSTAAGAGLGGIIGGRKGALIGAALAGGGATLYEVRK